MSTKIIPITLKNKYFTFNALAFIPSLGNEIKEIRNEWCIFSHGYTTSKSDCLNWAHRTSDAGSPTIIFDHPGHYLGSFNEVENFDDFKNHAHENYFTAFTELEKLMGTKPQILIFGGHSLGALLSIKAQTLKEFEPYKTVSVAVGIGIGVNKTTHLFETSFYEKTLRFRRQLVSPALDSDNVFPWIREEKLNLNLKGKRIHMITGVDDVVVGNGGMEAMKFALENDNTVTSIEPSKLPHHEPGHAASYVYSFLKKEFNWT